MHGWCQQPVLATSDPEVDDCGSQWQRLPRASPPKTPGPRDLQWAAPQQLNQPKDPPVPVPPVDVLQCSPPRGPPLALRLLIKVLTSLKTFNLKAGVSKAEYRCHPEVGSAAGSHAAAACLLLLNSEVIEQK